MKEILKFNPHIWSVWGIHTRDFLYISFFPPRSSSKQIQRKTKSCLNQLRFCSSNHKRSVAGESRTIDVWEIHTRRVLYISFFLQRRLNKFEMEIEWLKDFKRVVLLNSYRRPFLVAIVYKTIHFRHLLFRFSDSFFRHLFRFSNSVFQIPFFTFGMSCDTLRSNPRMGHLL